MHQVTFRTLLCRGLLPLLLTGFAAAQTAVDSLAVKAIAEVESRTLEGGKGVVKLIPADRVVPGDRVIYTLEVRNTGAAELAEPVVVHPIPEHMQYVANSAVGPGAAVQGALQERHHPRAEEPARSLREPLRGGQAGQGWTMAVCQS